METSQNFQSDSNLLESPAFKSFTTQQSACLIIVNTLQEIFNKKYIQSLQQIYEHVQCTDKNYEAKDTIEKKMNFYNTVKEFKQFEPVKQSRDSLFYSKVTIKDQEDSKLRQLQSLLPNVRRTISLSEVDLLQKQRKMKNSILCYIEKYSDMNQNNLQQLVDEIQQFKSNSPNKRISKTQKQTSFSFRDASQFLIDFVLQLLKKAIEGKTQVKVLKQKLAQMGFQYQNQKDKYVELENKYSNTLGTIKNESDCNTPRHLKYRSQSFSSFQKCPPIRPYQPNKQLQSIKHQIDEIVQKMKLFSQQLTQIQKPSMKISINLTKNIFSKNKKYCPELNRLTTEIISVINNVLKTTQNREQSFLSYNENKLTNAQKNAARIILLETAEKQKKNLIIELEKSREALLQLVEEKQNRIQFLENSLNYGKIKENSQNVGKQSLILKNLFESNSLSSESIHIMDKVNEDIKVSPTIKDQEIKLTNKRIYFLETQIANLQFDKKQLKSQQQLYKKSNDQLQAQLQNYIQLIKQLQDKITSKNTNSRFISQQLEKKDIIIERLENANNLLRERNTKLVINNAQLLQINKENNHYKQNLHQSKETKSKFNSLYRQVSQSRIFMQEAEIQSKRNSLKKSILKQTYDQLPISKSTMPLSKSTIADNKVQSKQSIINRKSIDSFKCNKMKSDVSFCSKNSIINILCKIENSLQNYGIIKNSMLSHHEKIIQNSMDLETLLEQFNLYVTSEIVAFIEEKVNKQLHYLLLQTQRSCMRRQQL